jgi:hypothetical protein
MYSKHSLNISGKRSVTFMAEEIAFASNRETSEETMDDWDAVKVYKIDPDWAAQQEKETGSKIDPYTVGVARCSKWLGKRDRYRVFYCQTIGQILGIVKSHATIFLREIEEELRLNGYTPTGELGHESRARPVES